jgi:hypothetical protein
VSITSALRRKISEPNSETSASDDSSPLWRVQLDGAIESEGRKTPSAGPPDFNPARQMEFAFSREQRRSAATN